MSERINAGRLRWTLHLYRPVRTVGRGNAPVETFELMATVKAEKIDKDTSERLRGGQVAGTITTRFKFRWSPTAALLDSTFRAVCEGRHYEITGVLDIDRQRGREILAVARTDQLKLYA